MKELDRQTEDRGKTTNPETDRRSTPISASSISVDEAMNLYTGKWILMKVTAFDQDHLPSHGEIISHGPSHSRIWKRLTKLISDSGKSSTPYYVFQACLKARTGIELQAVLEETRRTGAAAAWRRW